MKNPKIIFIIILVISALGLSGCASENVARRLENTPAAGETEKKISVAASFYPLYFFAREIGGERAEVFSITPAGVEPHDYELTPSVMASVENSRLLIINGSGLEVWGDDMLKNINPQKTAAVVAGEGLINNASDPHFWLSPILAGRMVDKIAAGFIQADPTGAVYYRTNVTALKEKLAALDREYQTGLSQCARKIIVTAHAAFGHLAAAFGLEQKAIAGLSPEAEPSPRELAVITEFAKANGVKYIFFESLVSPKLAETIAREISAETLILNPLEGLTAEEVAAGKDYFTVMRSNLINLQIALQCQK